MSGTDLIVWAVVLMGVIGLMAAVILYIVAKKFHVQEDPRIAPVRDMLPGANCGGCGYPGCNAFAEAIVKKESLEGMFCPVAGNDPMADIAAFMGVATPEQAPYVAVIRCGCSPVAEHARDQGASDCYVAAMNISSDCGCPQACLGLGDCVRVCAFEAIKMHPETRLPVVSDDRCNACGSCVKECPRKIIELRRQHEEKHRVFVACVNTEKGAVARKHCGTACIACNLCFKACAFNAIRMKDNLAVIEDLKCTLCLKCVSVCPNETIHAVQGRTGLRMTKEEIKQAEGAS